MLFGAGHTDRIAAATSRGFLRSKSQIEKQFLHSAAFTYELMVL